MPYTPHTMPGPGDSITWPAYSGHPLDPRAPFDDERDEELYELKSERDEAIEAHAYIHGMYCRASVLAAKLTKALPASVLADPQVAQLVGALQSALGELHQEEFDAAAAQLAEVGL